MEIESYEPYHIGTKLNPHVNFDALKNKVKKALEEKSYEVIKEPVIELPIKIGPPTEILGVKNNVRVELNLAAQALNVIGDKPVNVIEIFKEITTLLPNLGYDLEATTLFYEILATIIIKSDKNPAEMLAKSSKVNLESLKDIANMTVDGLKMGSITTSERQDLIGLIIEPSPVSPSNRFSVRLIYRTREKEKIESFHGELEDRVMEVMRSLEST